MKRALGPQTLPAVFLAGSLLAGCAGSTGARAGAVPERTPEVEEASVENAVRLALLEKLGSEVMGVTVEVDGDRARLSGEVRSRSTQELAEEVALSVAGVRRVDNLLTADQESGAATAVGRAADTTELEVQDAVLEMRVGQRLLQEIGRYALDLEVEVTDAVVSLRGRLPDRERKSLALQTAKETSGVKTVIDLLDVR